MKKLLVLLVLCMVVCVALVACETNPDNPVDETTADKTTTEATTTEPGETTTEEVTTEPGSETSTEENTTEPGESSSEETTEPPAPVFEGNWHASVDSFMYCVNDDFSDVVDFTAAATNNINGTTITNGTGTLTSVTANYVYFSNGWLAVDGYALENWSYSIYAADGTLLKTAALTLREAEIGVVEHVANNMKYAEGTVSNRVGQIDSEIISLKEFANQTVTVVYSVDPVGTEFTIDLIKLEVSVPADPNAPTFVLDANAIVSANPVNELASATVSEDGTYAILVGANDGANGDVWMTMPVANVTGARYIAIKYRTTMDRDGQIFIGSQGGPTGSGDCPMIDYTSDGNWQLAIVDLADEAITSVDKETYKLAYLRYDFFTNGKDDATIEVGYIAAFNSIEAAQAYFAKSFDTNNTFQSDVNSNEVDTPMGNTDLAGIMQLKPGTNGAWSVVEIDGAKYYSMSGIDAIVADMNGTYYFKANIKETTNNAGVGFIVRGYNGTVSTDPNVPFALTNFYETDDAGFCGGSGIYAYVNNGKLTIVVKYYDAAKGTRVGNKIYNLACEGTELVMADDGYTVSIMVNGVTYATIDLSGSVAYEDITTTPANGVFATQAVVTLKDGTTETIENTLVSATVNSQIGITCRASKLVFSSVEVGGFSAIEVPALEIVEPEPVDPNAPIVLGTPEYIVGQATSSGNHIAGAVLSEDGTFATITSTNDGDPSFWLVPGGSALSGVNYVAIKYRTTVDGGNEFDGEIFVGSANITGGADEIKFEYINDGAWHVMIIDLTNHSTVVDSYVNYIRYDFFAGSEGSIDFESIALFSTKDAAEAYYGIVEEPEQPAEDPFYAISFYQANLEATYYFTGAMDGYYLATSTNAADAAKVYVETHEEGLRMYVLVDDVKTYIEIYEYENKGQMKGGVRMTTEPTTYFVFNTDANTYVTDLGETGIYYLGTYKTYATVSASNISYITGDSAANVGVSQFPIEWVEYPTVETP